jgi:exopolysaccharide biosynthesis polyprenyl glycosylphosphotransferase
MAGLGELGVLVRSGRVDTALVAPSGPESAATLRLVLDQARVSTLDVKVLPQVADQQFADVSSPSSRLSRLGDIPVIELQRRPLNARALFIKRVEDLVVGTAMLVVLSPILAMVALAIRIDSKGPIFFRQPRVGLNGNVFEMFKFRSMYHHASDHGAARQTQRGDPRVTRVGAILRRHSLDELPQILNVLRGDMSIVGPRPHALAMTAQGMALEEAAKDYPARFRMKPGITGWAQTNGWRGNVDTVEKLVRRVEHDLFYIDHWSVGLDLMILRKTVSCVFSDETAY